MLYMLLLLWPCLWLLITFIYLRSINVNLRLLKAVHFVVVLVVVNFVVVNLLVVTGHIISSCGQ